MIRRLDERKALAFRPSDLAEASALADALVAAIARLVVEQAVQQARLVAEPVDDPKQAGWEIEGSIRSDGLVELQGETGQA